MSDASPMMRATEQAWALPVQIDTLGAHLEAYATLRPVLDTLRLCNRFGRGDRGISKLPVEMVDLVAGYLIEDERELERTVWAEDLKCWDGLCEPIDHVGPGCLHHIFHAMQEAGELYYRASDTLCVAHAEVYDEHQNRIWYDPAHSVKDCELYVIHTARTLCSPEYIASQREKVADRLNQLHDSGDPAYRRYANFWSDTCGDSQSAWRERIGDDKCRGRLQELSAVLENDFGLQIRVVRSCWKPSQTPSCNRSTHAYLHLPVSRAVGTTGSRSKPSAMQLARFKRVVRMLLLQVDTGTAHIVVLDNDEDDTGTEHTAAGDQDEGDEEGSDEEASDENDDEEGSEVVENQDGEAKKEDHIITEPRLTTFCELGTHEIADRIWQPELPENANCDSGYWEYIEDSEVEGESIRAIRDDDYVWAVVKKMGPEVDEFPIN